MLRVLCKAKTNKTNILKLRKDKIMICIYKSKACIKMKANLQSEVHIYNRKLFNLLPIPILNSARIYLLTEFQIIVIQTYSSKS